MKKAFFLLILLSLCKNVFAQNKTIIYLFAGQGADERLFKNLIFDSTKFRTKYIKYEVPFKHETLPQYAKRLAAQIDTSTTFSLIGTSLGGMIATEICGFLHPKQTFIISSAKCRAELPFRYRFQKKLPIYAIFPAKVIKLGAMIMQPLVEPDRNFDKKTFVAMLKAKNPKFLKRTIFMITHWQRSDYEKKIIHIHGDNDHTLPIRNIKYDNKIKGGSHMITLTRGSEISVILEKLLEN